MIYLLLSRTLLQVCSQLLWQSPARPTCPGVGIEVFNTAQCSRSNFWRFGFPILPCAPQEQVMHVAHTSPKLSKFWCIQDLTRRLHRLRNGSQDLHVAETWKVVDAASAAEAAAGEDEATPFCLRTPVPSTCSSARHCKPT